jgi:DHA1 family bicyclomycin/chloramphenicol resistance-like MFS transporter
MTAVSDAEAMSLPRRLPPFLILVVVSAVGPLALNLFMPSVPGLQAEFGVSTGTVQLTLTLYLVGMAASQLLYGPLSDRFGRRPILLAGLVVFSLASAFAAIATSIGLLVWARLAQAVGGSAGMVLARAMVRDVHERDKSASVIGYITMAWVIAPMFAPAIGGVLDRLAGWRSGFALLALVGAVVLAATWRFLPETHTVRRSGPLVSLADCRRLLTTPRFLGYVVTLGFSSGVFFVFLAGAPHIMVNVLHRTPLDYGVWFMVVSVGYMIGNFLSGRLSESHGADRMVRYGNVSILAGTGIALAALLLGFQGPHTLFLPMMLVALGNGLTVPNGIAGAISVDPRAIGTAAGLSGFLQMAICALLSQAVGSAQDAWPAAMYWVMAASAVVATVSHSLAMANGRR